MPATPLVHFRHVEGGAVVSYDKASLEGALREVTDPMFAAQQAKRRKGRQHHLIEIAKQVRKGTLTPCAAPREVPRLPEVDAETAEEIVRQERKLKQERLERELAELKAQDAQDDAAPAAVPEVPQLELPDFLPGVDEDLPSTVEDADTPFGDIPPADALSVDEGPVVAGGEPSSTKPRTGARRAK